MQESLGRDASGDQREIKDPDRWVSRGVAGVALSAIKAMAMRSAKVEGAASLTWGVPSFRTPAHIRRAVAERMEAEPEIGKYSLPDGLPELRRAAAKVHLDATGIQVDPDRNVVITAGNMEGLSTLFRVLIDPGDEIILTDPGFASHITQIRLCGDVQPPALRLVQRPEHRLAAA